MTGSGVANAQPLESLRRLASWTPSNSARGVNLNPKTRLGMSSKEHLVRKKLAERKHKLLENPQDLKLDGGESDKVLERREMDTPVAVDSETLCSQRITKT